MGDDSQIPDIERGSVKIQHGEFKNVLYVPSLAIIFLFVYQMTHTISPKRVAFESDLVEITEKATRNLIAKGIANHGTKAYEFSLYFFCFTSYSSIESF